MITFQHAVETPRDCSWEMPVEVVQKCAIMKITRRNRVVVRIIIVVISTIWYNRAKSVISLANKTYAQRSETQPLNEWKMSC
jgi:cell division protein FtsL